MNKLFSILKYTAIDNSNLNKFFGKNKSIGAGKVTAWITGIIGLTILIEIMVTIYTFSLWIGLEEMKIQHLVLPISMIVASIAVFISTVYKAQGILFTSKDYDLLMSMPIKSSTVLIAKIIYLIAVNVIFTALITAPAAVIYFLNFGGGIMYFIYYILLVILLPLLPILLSSIVAFLISYVSTKFKRKNAITNILSLAFVAMIMIFSFNISSYMQVMAQNIQAIEDGIRTYYPPAGYYESVLTSGNILDLIKYIGVNIIALAIFTFILSKLFSFINMKLKETPKAKKYQNKKLNVSRPVIALYRKEIKRYFSSSIYVMNTAFGLVMLLGGRYILFIFR